MIQNHDKQVQNSSKELCDLKSAILDCLCCCTEDNEMNEGHVQERNNDKESLREKIQYW